MRFAAVILVATAPAFAGPERVEAVLEGHAILAADTLIPPPAGAPVLLQRSGRWAGSAEALAPLPLAGQPVQGISAIAPLGAGRFLALSDNGFGTRENSADAMLALHELVPDFRSGTVEYAGSVFLSDPDRVLPFPLALEADPGRFLTGADLDPESLEIAGDHVVIGEEFGPWLLRADRATGAVTTLRGIVEDGTDLRSPDHPALRLEGPGAPPPLRQVRRSRGFEGLATTDGGRLLAMLEGRLHLTGDAAFETTGQGAAALRIIEIAPETLAQTGRHWLYPLEDPAHAIGGLAMLPDGRGLVIERDGGQGDASRACAGKPAPGCFPRPAAFKRIYLIAFDDTAPGGVVEKRRYIDLLDIADPAGAARRGAQPDGRFSFPFVTIESLSVTGGNRLVVVNDNNYPFSAGREPDRPDDTEFILLDAGDLLAWP